MGDLSKYREKAITAGKLACQYDTTEKYEEACKYYMESIQYFLHLIKYEKNTKLISTYKDKVNEYMERAEYLKKNLKDKDKPTPVGAAAGGKKGGEGEEEKDGNEKLKGALSSAIVTEKPNIKWDDVAGLEAAKAALQEAVILPTRYPQFFEGKRKPWKGILLYGPPGTGKSYLAKACATEADATFFSVSSSDLVSKWLGDSERLVRSLFEMARENKPSIIFIDEIDSLCGGRAEGENDTSRRIKTEFLVQMQGVGKDDTGILVLGATNVPWELDAAIRRRFERRIYIPLPEEAARARIFDIHLGATPHKLTHDDFLLLGGETEGYSGSDICIIVKDAMMEPIRKCQRAKKFKKTQDGFWEPTNYSDPSGVEKTLFQIEDPSTVRAPIICYDDFMNSFTKVKASVAPEDLEKQQNFTDMFGQEGN